MNRPALEEVVRLLREFKENGYVFDMCYWKKYDTNNCKTVCCAVGLYLENHPESQLRLIPSDFNQNNYFPGFDHINDENVFIDVAAFFGLDAEQAQYLFDPLSYKSIEETDPIVVANRIQAFLDKHDETTKSN